MYVHWQRQFLHPWLLAFDAPSREECTAQRPISNTPTAALVLLNDPSFVEAARALAAQVLDRSAEATTPSESRWTWRQRARPRADDDRSEAARCKLAGKASRRNYADRSRRRPRRSSPIGISPRPTDVDAAELAAWTWSAACC